MNIIFVNGTNWNGSANQTEDMKFSTDACIQLTQSGDQKAKYVIVDCDAATSIEDMLVNHDFPRKSVIDGALYLFMSDGSLYDVRGNLVDR